MKTFLLQRDKDMSGVSGLGVVAYGVEFPDGKVVLWWKNYSTISIFDDIYMLTKIHGHGNATKVVYL